MTDTAQPLSRTNVEALDKLLGVPFHVLDEGFVRVIDYMGSDEAIVQAARVSYGRGTKRVSEDRGLIRYLMRHQHMTPFEMCEIKLHVRVPMDSWRQWIRHRTASVNEYSTRYSEAIDVMQKTKPDAWRCQSAACKQGSSDMLDATVGATLSQEEEEFQAESRRIYGKRLELGVAREQARKDLPLSTYTEAYWKTNLRNLLHFLTLRMEGHAQLEIRSYADIIGKEIVACWCPSAWEAFVDYQFDCQSFSRLETNLLREINAGRSEQAVQLAKQYGWLESGPNGLLRHRERAEFQEKLANLGLNAPW